MSTFAAARTAMQTRTIRVMHLSSVETPNYYLNNLVDFLEPESVDFSVFTTGSNKGFISELQKRGVEGGAFNALRRTQMPDAYQQTIAAIRRVNPDIVHTHLFEPSLIGARAAKKLDK